MDGVKEPLNINYHNIYLKYLLNAINTEKANLYLDDSTKPLTEFEKTVFVSIISDMVHQIGIMNQGKVTTHSNPMHKKSMATRYSKPIAEDLYDEKTLRPFGEALQAICETKLENDLAMLRDLLEKCYNEIKSNESFTVLSDFVAMRNCEAYEEYELIKTYVENATKADELTEKLKRIQKTDRNHFNQFEYETDNEAERTELKKIHSMEQNMVKMWEESRLEQFTDIFENEIKRLEMANSTLKKKTMDDSITMERLKVFNDCKYKKIEDLIVYWTEKCATEKNVLGEKIKDVKSSIKTVWSKYEAISSSYRERETFIENYRSEQKTLERQKQQEMRKRNAALYIQAWWRGVMVRKQLGPYRPKKKKGKKGGKN